MSNLAIALLFGAFTVERKNQTNRTHERFLQINTSSFVNKWKKIILPVVENELFH